MPEGIANPGPRLRRQIDQLDKALRRFADTGDRSLFNRTSSPRLAVYKVADLGSLATSLDFIRSQASMLLQGERTGYRDVSRVEFEVSAQIATRTPSWLFAQRKV